MAEAPEQGNSRLSQAQAQVGEVVDIMRVNVEKVLERDSKLSELDQRADNLQEGANQFQTQVNFSLTPFDTIYGMYSQLNDVELFVVESVFIASWPFQQATRLKRKYWWQNMKMMAIIGVVVAVILLIIIISATSG